MFWVLLLCVTQTPHGHIDRWRWTLTPPLPHFSLDGEWSNTTNIIFLSWAVHTLCSTLSNIMLTCARTYFCMVTYYMHALIVQIARAAKVFGDLTDSPILSNLPRDGSLGHLITVVKLLTAVSVLSSYPVLNNVLVREIEDAVGCSQEEIPSRPKYLLFRTAIRLGCVAVRNAFIYLSIYLSNNIYLYPCIYQSISIYRNIEVDRSNLI